MPREICWLPLPDGYLSRQEPTLLIMGQFLSASSQVIIEFWINTHAAIMGSRSPMSCCLLPGESGKLAVSFDPSLKAGEFGKLIAEFLVWVQKPKHQEQQYLKAREDEYLSWSKESEFTLPLPFCSVRGLSGLDDWCPPALAKVTFFTPSTDSNANLFQRYPITPWNNVHQLSEHLLAQSSWHIKFTIRHCVASFCSHGNS